MSGNKTFTMIKPDAVESGNIGNIIQMITDAGFNIKASEAYTIKLIKQKHFMLFMQKDHFMDELVEYDFRPYCSCSFRKR